MKGKSKLALIGLAAVLGLTILGLGAGTALVAASDNATDEDSTTAVVSESDEANTEDSRYEIFVGKLADRLGLDEETVSTAISEVREEMRLEALEKRLQEAVEEGAITQEEADEILEWMKSRPDALDELGRFGMGLERGGRMKGLHRHGSL